MLRQESDDIRWSEVIECTRAKGVDEKKAACVGEGGLVDILLPLAYLVGLPIEVYLDVGGVFEDDGGPLSEIVSPMGLKVRLREQPLSDAHPTQQRQEKCNKKRFHRTLAEQKKTKKTVEKYFCRCSLPEMQRRLTSWALLLFAYFIR